MPTHNDKDGDEKAEKRYMRRMAKKKTTGKKKPMVKKQAKAKGRKR